MEPTTRVDGLTVRLKHVGNTVETVAIVIMITAVSLVLRLLIHWFIRYCVLGYRLGNRLDAQEASFVQKIGQLPYQLSITFVFPTLAGLAFTYPSFASAPFTGWEVYLKHIFEIFLGHLIGEFIMMSLRLPRCTFHFSLNLIHLIWVMVCYCVIISTKTNALFGVIGMLSYYINVHVYLHSMLKNCDNKLRLINLVAWFFAIALLGILTPIILSVYVHLHIQPIFELRAFHIVPYIVGLIYMLGLYLVQIRVILLAMWPSESLQVRTTSYPERKTDTNFLLQEKIMSHSGLYQSLIAIDNRDQGYGSVPSHVKKPTDQKLVLPLYI